MNRTLKFATDLNPGAKNIYVCDNCRKHIVTRDRANGVTPFMISCQSTAGCSGRMRSSLYRVFDPDNLLTPSHEWYKPAITEIVRPHLAEHVSKGGLLLRAITSTAQNITNRIVRHKKRGTSYRVIGTGKMQSDHWHELDESSSIFNSVDHREVTIYEGEDGQVWVRPADEFEERFEDL